MKLTLVGFIFMYEKVRIFVLNNRGLERRKDMVKNVAIVSLSSGIVGESFVEFEKNIGIKRLEDFGLNVKFMPHALLGLEYIKEHPEKRALDLLDALRDPDIDMILCAIGGDDTYRLLPYLFENDYNLKSDGKYNLLSKVYHRKRN